MRARLMLRSVLAAAELRTQAAPDTSVRVTGIRKAARVPSIGACSCQRPSSCAASHKAASPRPAGGDDMSGGSGPPA